MTTVLVVCTANVCRSPMAAALLARHLVTAGSAAQVVSAGTHIWSGAVAVDAVAVMAERGLDITEHSPRHLSHHDLDHADLVVVMDCAHIAHVVALDQSAFGKTFSARELVARAEQHGGRRDGESLADFLARLHIGRRAADLLRMAGELDIEDPIGQPREAFERCADELERLMHSIAEIVE